MSCSCTHIDYWNPCQCGASVVNITTTTTTTTLCPDGEPCEESIDLNCIIYCGPDIPCWGVQNGQTAQQILGLVIEAASGCGIPTTTTTSTTTSTTTTTTTIPPTTTTSTSTSTTTTTVAPTTTTTSTSTTTSTTSTTTSTTTTTIAPPTEELVLYYRGVICGEEKTWSSETPAEVKCDWIQLNNISPISITAQTLKYYSIDGINVGTQLYQFSPGNPIALDTGSYIYTPPATPYSSAQIITLVNGIITAIYELTDLSTCPTYVCPGTPINVTLGASSAVLCEGGGTVISAEFYEIAYGDDPLYSYYVPSTFCNATYIVSSSFIGLPAGIYYLYYEGNYIGIEINSGSSTDTAAVILNCTPCP